MKRFFQILSLILLLIDLDPVGSALFAVTNQKPVDLEPAPVFGAGTMVKSTGPVIVNRESDNILMVNYLDLNHPIEHERCVFHESIKSALY